MPPQEDMMHQSSNGSIKLHWQGNDNDDDMDALVPPRAKPQPSKRKSSKKQRQALALSCVIAVLFTVLAASLLPLSSSSRGTSRLKQNVPDVILQLGWVDAIEKFREELVGMVVVSRREELKAGSLDSQFVDISPFREKIVFALDTFGVRALYTQVYHELELYYPKKWHKSSKECDAHGIGCYWQDPWWLWHYVGAITAEKLFQDGSLLLDGITRERLPDAVSFMKEIHRIQHLPNADTMSFHAEHGFLWHYLAVAMPDLETYPTELAQEFCGDYLGSDQKFVSPSAGKSIGYECYHGFGHAVYTVVANRQLGGSSSNYTTQTMIRPHGGFALTDESFCETYKICSTAPQESHVPEKACHGGIRHSYKLFSNTLPRFKDKYENQEWFARLDKIACQS